MIAFTVSPSELCCFWHSKVWKSIRYMLTLGPGRTYSFPRAVCQLFVKWEVGMTQMTTPTESRSLMTLGSDCLSHHRHNILANIETHKQLNLEVAVLPLSNKGSIFNFKKKKRALIIHHVTRPGRPILLIPPSPALSISSFLGQPLA